MADDFNNKIRGLKLENFTCFAKAEMDFSSGINVFIGENGTGKTHVLKVLYALNNAVSKIEIGKNLITKEKTYGQFNPYAFIQELAITFGTYTLLDVFRENEKGETSFVVSFENELKFGIKFKTGELSETIIALGDTHSMQKPLYIPPYEMLSMVGSFAVDKTYFDLINALNSKKNGVDYDILMSLQELIKIDVSKENDNFYIKYEKDIQTKAQLAATGINKIAQLMPLIQNGWLTKKSILFWDEPEVNLNPKYIRIVAKFLQTLAINGVQIFVATHDYLLAHLLSLDAEYREETQAPSMKFFSFYKGEDGTEIEAADTIAGLQHNALLDEYAAYYDLEQALFRKSMQNV